MKEFTAQELKELSKFQRQELTPEQLTAMGQINEMTRSLMKVMFTIVPNSADRTAGIRSLRLAAMQCNAAIVYEWENKE
jgi:hypothetical protein